MVEPDKVPRVKLSDGHEMPIIGLGTWQSPKGEVYSAVKEAIEAGYRHFDCAMVYQNERDVGKALNEVIADGRVKREELFVTTKLWLTYFERDRVMKGIKTSLEQLGLDYVDLYLVHWPVSLKQVDELFPKDADGNLEIQEVDLSETWQGMEDLVKAGLAKSIGISNFNSKQIDDLLSKATIKPVVNQVECHPYLAQKKLIKFCEDRQIKITAYSPLGNPGSNFNPVSDDVKHQVIDNKVVKELAEKYKKSAGQILIKFQVQRGVIVIPKSVHKKRIEENIQVFDFELNDDEISALEALDCNYRSCHMQDKGIRKYKNYPFQKDIEF